MKEGRYENYILKISGNSFEVNGFDYVISNFTNNMQLSGEEYFKMMTGRVRDLHMMIGMDKSFNELSHFNILFSDDYENEFIDIFEKKIPADDMTIYISISKKDEPGDAPTGCENWFVYVNAPYLSDKFYWTKKIR